MTPTAQGDASSPSPPRPLPPPRRRTHSGLSGLLGRMFSPSRLEQGGGHFGSEDEGEGQGETDSAYRDLGLDPDKLTDFNVATDIPLADVEGGDGAGAGGRGRGTAVPMSPPADERRSKSWRWGRGRRTESHSRGRSRSGSRSRTRSRSRGLSLSRHRKSSSRFVEDDIPPPLPVPGQQQQSQYGLSPAAGAMGKGKGKLTKPQPTRLAEPLPPLPKIRPSSTYAEASALANAPDTNAPLPPLPPSLITYTPQGQRPLPPPPTTTETATGSTTATATAKPAVKPTAEELLRAKEQVRRERRDLRASGDWLGVQGSDPVTGEPEVLTPLDTPTASGSSGSSSSAARRLLAGLAGRRRDAEAELARAQEQEERGRLHVRDARDARHRAKLESIERRKEGIRARRLALASAAAAVDDDGGGGGEEAGGAGAGGDEGEGEGAGGVTRRRRQHSDQWSSLVEPKLSPIAQSVNSSANNLLEPSPSPPTVPGPASAMPNFSRPRASGSGNSPLQFLGHFRNRSTDTIVHNPAKSPDRERHSAAGYPTPRKSQEPGPGRRRRQPEEEEEGKEEAEAAGKSFLWRRRRRMTDPGSRYRTPAAAGIGASAAAPLDSACGFPPGSPSAPPRHHHRIMDVAIPDYHLHLLTPDPAGTPKTPANPTGAPTTISTTLSTPPNPGRGGKAANDRDQCTSAATVTSYLSRPKELMRKLSVCPRKSLLRRQGSGRVSAARATTEVEAEAEAEAEEAEESPTGASRRSLDGPPMREHTPLYKGDGLEVRPGSGERERRCLGMSLGDARTSGPHLHAHHQDHVDIPSLSLRDVQSNGRRRRHRHRGAALPLAELPVGNKGKAACRSSRSRSRSRSRSLSPAQTATPRPVRRFAFIPTTTTTGCDRDRGSRSADTQKENRPTRPDSLIVETSSDDPATPTSSPSPMRLKEEETERERGERRAGQAIVIPESWARVRHSRRIPLRKSSLNFTPTNSALEDSTDEEMLDARATGTTSTRVQSTTQSDETTESEVYVSARSEAEEEPPSTTSTRTPEEPTSFPEEDTPTGKIERDGLGKARLTVSPTRTTRATRAQEDTKGTGGATVGRVKMLARGFDQRERKDKNVGEGSRQEGLEVIPVVLGDTPPARHRHHHHQGHHRRLQTSEQKRGAEREILDQDDDTDTETDTDEEETGLDGTFDGILDGFPVPPTSKHATAMYVAPSPRIMRAAAMWGGAKQAAGTIALSPRQDHHHPLHHYQAHGKTKSCNGAELAATLGSTGVGIQEPGPDKWRAGLTHHRRSRSDENRGHVPRKDIPRGRVLGSQMTGMVGGSSRSEAIGHGAGAAPTDEEVEKALQSTLQRKLEQEIQKEKARQRKLEGQMNTPHRRPAETLLPLPEHPQTSSEIEYRITGQEKFFAIPNSVLPPRHPSQVQARHRRRKSQVLYEVVMDPPSRSPSPPPRRFPPRVTDPPETPPPQPEMQETEPEEQRQGEVGAEADSAGMGARSWLPSLPTRLPLLNLGLRRRRGAAPPETPDTTIEGRRQPPDQRGRRETPNRAVSATGTTGLPEHTPDAVKAARKAAIHDRDRKNGGVGVSTVDIANKGGGVAENAALTPLFVAPLFIAYLLARMLRTTANLAWAILSAWWFLARPALVDWFAGADDGVWRRRRAGRATWADTVSLIAAALLCAASVVVGWYLGVFSAWLGLV